MPVRQSVTLLARLACILADSHPAAHVLGYVCIYYDGGKWVLLTETTLEKRIFNASWIRLFLSPEETLRVHFLLQLEDNSHVQ